MQTFMCDGINLTWTDGSPLLRPDAFKPAAIAATEEGKADDMEEFCKFFGDAAGGRPAAARPGGGATPTNVYTVVLSMIGLMLSAAAGVIVFLHNLSRFSRNAWSEDDKFPAWDTICLSPELTGCCVTT